MLVLSIFEFALCVFVRRLIPSLVFLVPRKYYYRFPGATSLFFVYDFASLLLEFESLPQKEIFSARKILILFLLTTIYFGFLMVRYLLSAIIDSE
mmetsp:Transcript_18985/g.21453  ORF Transcript_18985/g.21453 Transcript_18985/m.21453 type:complete len:95 (+) Transcript_18985:535-819(+)